MSRLKSRGLVALLAVMLVMAWLVVNGLLSEGRSFGHAVEAAATFNTLSLSLFIEAVPFLLLGTLASGLVEVYVGGDFMRRWVPCDPMRGVLVGAVLGLFLPVGECGVVPLTRRLLRKGLPLPAAIAFMLAAPVVNPIVIAGTLAAFGLGQVLALRLGLTLLIAVVTGLIFARTRQPERWLMPSAWPVVAGASGLPGCTALPAPPTLSPHDRGPALRRAAAIAVDEFFELGALLVAGALLAAGLQTQLPQAALPALASGPVTSAVAMLMLAVSLSVGSLVDAFVALPLASQMMTGSLLAFLVFGPMVDLKSTLLYLSVFRRRTVAGLVLAALLMNFVIAVAINAVTAGLR
jgi:uncharacterized protein